MSLDSPVLREETVDLELLDLRDLRATKETPGRLDHLVLLGTTGSTAPGDLLDRRERRASLAFREAPAPEVHLEWRDRRVTLELLASLETLENRALAGSRESLAILVTMAGRETEVSRGTQDLLASPDCRDLLASLACQVHLVSRAMLDLQEPRETLDPSDLLDCKVLLATRDLLDPRDPRD